jgi:DNA-binding IclR family transcriptional regulator
MVTPGAAGRNAFGACVFHLVSPARLAARVFRMEKLNRSLERGLAVLECFRPGVSVLSHGDIGERTGLPKPTVSRLLKTLVLHGYLAYDPRQRAYGLGLPLLSLSWTYTLGNALHERMAPLIDRLARETRSIIGFGTAHDTDIVYLAACNGDAERADRRIGVGMRAPLLSTSVGRAYLAALAPKERAALLAALRASAQWRPALRAELSAAFARYRQDGMCLVPRSKGRQVAVGIALPVDGAPMHALGIGYRLGPSMDPSVVPKHIAQALEALRAAVEQFNQARDAAPARRG